MSENEEEKSEWEDVLVPLPEKICPKCSRKYPLTEKYCSECGTNLIEENELGKYRKTEEQHKQYEAEQQRRSEEERRNQNQKIEYLEEENRRMRQKLEAVEEESIRNKSSKKGGFAKYAIIALLLVFGIVSYKMYDKSPKLEETKVASATSELEKKNADLQAQLAAEKTAREQAEAKAAELKKQQEEAAERDRKDQEAKEAERQRKAEEAKKKKEEQRKVQQSAASKYNVGDIISFGKWPVGIFGETAQAIEWEILEKKSDGTAIVLSSKVIDTKPYNTEQKDITWAESSLRKWLNGEFFSKAFNPKEKDAIVETTLKNADNNEVYTQAYIDWWKKWGYYSEGDEERYLGKRMNGKGGVDTTDNVWLLSLDDMKRYGRRFSTDASRIGKPMEYLKKKWNFCTSEACKRNGAVGNAWWWLRSPGYSQSRAALVSGDGFVRAHGCHVDFGNGGVRAALKININNL